MDYKVAYQSWLNNPKINAEAYDELINVKDNDAEIEYRFSQTLQFGTAGMRGIIGYGTNMMNVYTVARATKGLAEYIKSLGTTAMSRGVVISYDTRKNSLLFAKKTAGVLLLNGIKVYLYEKARPVPMLSFAVRHFKAVAGVMITASHNPKEYNGYKVYGSDGAQMSPEDTDKVVEFIDKVNDYFSIDAIKIETLKNSRLLKIIKQNFDNKYVNTLKKLSLSKNAVKKYGKKLKIVYTPLHGTGYAPVTLLLKKLGINYSLCDEQIMPDSEFSTVKVPNPEMPEALSLAMLKADKISADVVLGTDPDSDRLGVAIRDDKDKFINLTGNQVGVLLANYIMFRLKSENLLNNNPFIVKSFVSTNMINAICKDYGVKLIETPVGFKFIGEKIKESEINKNGTFIFGFEESCGYLRGTHARDKDAVVATMLFSEMTCYYEYNNQTVYGVLQDLYKKYGYTIEKTISTSYSGANAMNEMNKVVDLLKTKDVKNIGKYNVLATRNYANGTIKYTSGKVENLEYDNINCMFYELEAGGFVCVRPSGTEPKLKVYYSVKGNTVLEAENMLKEVSTEFEKFLK